MAHNEISGDMVMIVNKVVDKKASVMIHTVTGEITFEEVKFSYEEVLTHPDFQRDIYAIWDVRDADASKFDSQDVIRLARYFETQIKNRAEYKVAVIVSLIWNMVYQECIKLLQRICQQRLEFSLILKKQ